MKVLLRNGATVITTTRFPICAAKTFEKESDFKQFQDRLHIYGVDFRIVSAIKEFCSMIRTKYAKLDILINNAA